MSGTERTLKLAEAAMMAAATHHAEIDRLRYEAWRAEKTKGKKRWEPMVDRAAMIATFQDLFRAAVEAVRKESSDGN